MAWIEVNYQDDPALVNLSRKFGAIRLWTEGESFFGYPVTLYGNIANLLKLQQHLLQTDAKR